MNQNNLILILLVLLGFLFAGCTSEKAREVSLAEGTTAQDLMPTNDAYTVVNVDEYLDVVEPAISTAAAAANYDPTQVTSVATKVITFADCYRENGVYSGRGYILNEYPASSGIVFIIDETTVQDPRMFAKCASKAVFGVPLASLSAGGGEELPSKRDLKECGNDYKIKDQTSGRTFTVAYSGMTYEFCQDTCAKLPACTDTWMTRD